MRNEHRSTPNLRYRQESQRFMGTIHIRSVKYSQEIEKEKETDSGYGQYLHKIDRTVQSKLLANIQNNTRSTLRS